MTRLQMATLLLAVALLAGACGGGTGDPVFGGSGATSTTVASTSTTGSDETTTTTVADGTTSTTTEATTTTVEASPIDELLAYLDTAPVEPPPGQPLSPLGSSDAAAAEAIAADVAASGADLPGVELFVFDVLGGEDRLLVIQLDDDVIAAAGDSGGDAYLTAVIEAPSLDTAGITRLVFNYHGSDDVGDYVVTATVAMAEIRQAQAEGTSAGDSMEVQVTRDGQVVQP